MATRIIKLETGKSVTITVPDEMPAGWQNGYADGFNDRTHGKPVHASVATNRPNDYRVGYMTGFNEAG